MPQPIASRPDRRTAGSTTPRPSPTTDPARVAGNLKVFDFELTAAEMAAISSLAQPDSRIVSPPGLSPAWDPTPSAREIHRSRRLAEHAV